MTVTIETILVGLASGFAAALVVSGVNLYTSRTGRFVHERWWERKADAYSEIIEALSERVDYYDHHYKRQLLHEEIPTDLRDKIDALWESSEPKIRKAKNLGAFLFSADAREALRILDRPLPQEEHPDDWFAHLEHSYACAEECLKGLVAAAKVDLAVPHRWRA